MLVPFRELLADAERNERAVGAFTAYNLETAVAVLEAASRRDTGVVLLLSERAFTSRAGPALARTLLAVATDARGPCCVQLDHATGLRNMEDAFAGGLGAVMADGSKLPYALNVELVAETVRVARRFSGAVEAELGAIEGDEECANAVGAGALTDPNATEAFVLQTGADCLAVSIGNVHGRYAGPPRLDLPLLKVIHAATSVPLSLHGASGLPNEQVSAAVARGIRKVNVNTELRDRYFGVVARRLRELRPGAQVLALQDDVITGLVEVVESKLALLAAQSTRSPS